GRRLLAADPFPPLAPPTLDLPPGDTVAFDAPPPAWAPDDDLRREMARLEAGGALPDVDHPPPPPGPALAAPAPPPLPTPPPPAPPRGRPAPAAAPAPSAPLPPAPRAGGGLGPPADAGDAAKLRAENEELHKLIEEMKQIFEQATAQEEAGARAAEELRGQVL